MVDSVEKVKSPWFRTMDMQLKIAAHLGREMPQGAAVLDFGCGAGALVSQYRRQGYSSFGCDYQPKEGPEVKELLDKGYLRLIDAKEYRLPFADNTFDYVVSNQVLEHVQDYSAAFSEINRVLKPGGASLHIFPSRFRIREGHVHVPFASLIQKKWWLLMWAYLGIRTASQKGMPPREVGEANHQYLTQHTNYIPEREIEKTLDKFFHRYCFCEDIYLQYVGRRKRLHRILASIPFFPTVFSLLRNRVLFFEKG